MRQTLICKFLKHTDTNSLCITVGQTGFCHPRNRLIILVPSRTQRPSGSKGKAGSFLRLFMIPGMAHCADGPGLNSIDPLPALELWVENGVAPDQIIAKRVDHGKTVMSRPVCPYPERTRYNGTGAIDSASSFQCTGL